MAELLCRVENCTYNQDCLCCKGEISVGGEHACREDKTCCESFREQGSTTMCRAEHVDIKGCGACDCTETACATFREQ